MKFTFYKQDTNILDDLTVNHVVSLNQRKLNVWS